MKEKKYSKDFLIDVLDGVGNVFQDVRSATIHVRYGCTHSKNEYAPTNHYRHLSITKF